MVRAALFHVLYLEETWHEERPDLDSAAYVPFNECVRIPGCMHNSFMPRMKPHGVLLTHNGVIIVIVTYCKI